MFSQDQFREFASECIASARSATSERERQQYLEMAKIWMTAAQQLEDGMTQVGSPPLIPAPGRGG
jgi:hypothetical protein